MFIENIEHSDNFIIIYAMLAPREMPLIHKWDLDRKNGGIKILTPFATTEFSYNDNQFDILKSVHGYIDSMLPEYCVVTVAARQLLFQLHRPHL